MAHYDQNYSFQDFLIAFLLSGRSSKRFFQILREQECKKRARATVQSTLTRLKNKNFVIRDRDGWRATKAGASYYKRKTLLSFLESPFIKSSPRNILIAFDIPEKRKHVRHWLRNQLKIYGYTMIQKSLWQGPGPIPDNFRKRIKMLSLSKNIKIFRLGAAR
ncbi:MAG: CRISPR-associated endonuclease Cas2 [Patescibacteria group bacterium]